MDGKEKVEAIFKAYTGKKWKTAPSAGNYFEYGETELSIRFIKSKRLVDYIVENFEDYLYKDTNGKGENFNCVEDNSWVDPDLIPIAVWHIDYHASLHTREFDQTSSFSDKTELSRQDANPPSCPANTKFVYS